MKSQNTCQSCKTKDCISKKNDTKWIGRSCQSQLYPANVTDNRSCILCTQCVKACPNDNIEVKRLKKSFSTFDFNQLQYPEIGMVSILMGFVSYEILSSWKLSKSFLLAPSDGLYQLLSPGFISPKLFEAVVLFLIIPITVLGIIAVLSKQFGGKSFGFYLRRLAGYLLPILAFGHVFKALIKTSTRIPYWRYAVNDPKGMLYAQKILDHSVSIQSIGWIDSMVMLLGISGLVFALYLSLRKLSKDKELVVINKWMIGAIVVIYFGMLAGSPFSSLF